MRIVGIIFASLVVIIGVAIYLLFSSIDGLVAEAIEKAGSEATKTKVEVESVDIKLSSGIAAINGLTVASPAGFSEPYLMTLGQISVNIDVGSLSEPPFIIDEVLIKSPHIVYEINESGGTNVDAMQGNMPEDDRRHPAKEEEQKEEEASEGGDDVRIIIRKFIIDDGELKVVMASSGKNPQTTKLPRIELTDIGGKNGATPEEVASEIMAAVFGLIGPAVMGLNVNQYVDDQLDKAQSQMQKELAKGKNKKALEDAGIDSGELMKGLFGK